MTRSPHHPLLLIGLLCLVGCSSNPKSASPPALAQQYKDQDAPIIRSWMKAISHASTLPDKKDLEGDDKLSYIQNYLHRKIIYGPDERIWQKSDYWATPLETLRRELGDCEDYVIAKYFSLKYAGIAENKMEIAFVRAKTGHTGQAEAHMVLLYRPKEHEHDPLILDSLSNDIHPASLRDDLKYVFGFNGQNPFPHGSMQNTFFTKWQALLAKMKQEGFE